FERELNAAVECSAVREAAVEESNERLRIRGRGRPAIREPRHPRKDLRGTGAILFSTYIDVAAARRVSPQRSALSPFLYIRSPDLHRPHIRGIHVDLIVCDHAPALQRLRQPLGLPELPDERDADNVRAGGDVRSDL